MLSYYLSFFTFLFLLRLVTATAQQNNVLDDVPKILLKRVAQPQDSSQTLRRREAGITQVALSNDGSSYFTVISIGNISFRVALDTASSDLWVLSSECSSSSCKSIPSYPLSSFHSPSLGVINNNDTTFNISFADGSTSSGFVATETVLLQNFTITDQVFGLVNSTNVTLKNEISGLLGLGFPRLSVLSGLVSNTTPFINGLAQQGQLDYPFFGLSLLRNASGTLSLGAIDADIVRNISSIEWHKVVPFSPFGVESNTASYLQWAIRLTSIGINGTGIAPIPTYAEITKSSLALVDVGTNGIFGPYQDVSRIFDLMDGARLVDAEIGQWALPCDTDEVITFNFGKGNFTLQPTDYLIGPTAGDPDLCLTWPRATINGGDGIDWQLGTPFLRTVYSIFSYGINDKETPMIGLYPISNVSVISQNASYISSFFASASATVATTLPNSVLSTPSPSTQEYIFNTSVSAEPGEIVTTALGTSTYKELLAGATVNASAIPTITANPTAVTFIITDASGIIVTSTSVVSTSSVALGRPPGQSSANALTSPLSLIYLTGLLFILQQLI